MYAHFFWDGNTFLMYNGKLEWMTELELFDVLWELAENDGA